MAFKNSIKHTKINSNNDSYINLKYVIIIYVPIHYTLIKKLIRQFVIGSSLFGYLNSENNVYIILSTVK